MKNKHVSIIEKMTLFEDGRLTTEETIEFFQELIDTDLVWKLYGEYGKQASTLIQKGYCHKKKEATRGQ